MFHYDLLDESQNKLDYVLSLTVENFLERPLQTLVFKSSMAKYIHHACVLIRQRHIRRFDVDIILLVGYLKLIPAELVQAFPKRIINIHPSLLPAFGGKVYYGIKVHKAVIASGARYSGATIHFVDEEYDRGRILAQRAVPVLANDTAEVLAARVLHEEHSLYVEVAAALCEDRIVWRDDGVPLIRSKEDPDNFS